MGNKARGRTGVPGKGKGGGGGGDDAARRGRYSRPIIIIARHNSAWPVYLVGDRLGHPSHRDRGRNERREIERRGERPWKGTGGGLPASKRKEGKKEKRGAFKGEELPTA